MPQTEAQKRAKRRYRSKCRTVTLVVYPTEPEIRRKLDEVPNISEYLKALIMEDIEGGD